MGSPADQDEGDVLPISLDRETLAWLAEISAIHGEHPRVIAASMLRAIMFDDEAAHAGTHTQH